MSEISMNTAVVFHKMETDYGELPTAFTAADAVLIKDMRLEPLTGERRERNLVRPFYGANPSKQVATRGTISFTTEAGGAGAAALDAGTAPAWGRLLRSAGCAQTIRAPAATIAASPPTGVGGPTGGFTYVAVDPYEGILDRTVTLTCTTAGGTGVAEFTVSAPAMKNLPAFEALERVMTDATPFALLGGATITPTIGTSFDPGDEFTIELRAPMAAYSPVSTGFESGHMFAQIGPNRHLYPGQRGNCTLAIEADNYFDLQFEMMGLPGARSSESIPAVDFSGFRDPLIVSDVNTPFVALGGEEVVLRSLSLNIGQQVSLRSLVGRKAVRIGDRASSGTIVFEAPDLATKDYFDDMEDGTVLELELIHGLVRGEIVHLVTRLELTSLTYQDEDGIAMFSANISALPSDAGNDEFVLMAK